MPAAQQEVLSPGRYLLRHIAPKSSGPSVAGIINPLGSPVTVLAATLYAKPLPVSHLPNSPDFHTGQYTLRLGDAGDFKLIAPNKDASDGQPWRNRFSTDGHLQWIEISREGEVEFIGVIVKQTLERDAVTLEGYDGFWPLKKVYEQDFTTVMAPRDFIERYTQAQVQTLVDSFTFGETLAATWTSTATGGGSPPFIGTPSGVTMSTGASGVSRIDSVSTFTLNSKPWRMSATIAIGGTPATNSLASMGFENGSGPPVYMYFEPGIAGVFGSSTAATLAATTVFNGSLNTYTLLFESDGRWVRGYINGQLIGYAAQPTGTGYTVFLNAQAGLTSAAALTCTGIMLRQQKDFLMAGSDKGDYVLPGVVSTYPTGGLHGRFVSYQGSGNVTWFRNVLAPDPRYPQATANNDREDPTIASPVPPTGVPGSYWGARWFGSVYLKLSGGNYGVALTIGNNVAVRLWVGKTNMGDQIIDQWSLAATTGYAGSINAAALGGKDGWYPMILEFAQGSPATGGSVTFAFQAPVSYTDPGGSVIGTGVTNPVPSTSLSPLGCVDQRVQGASYFDLVQQTAQNFGYQLALEPKTLESGLFPGVLAPRLREGKDWDEIIEADDLDRKSGINNYSNVLDATDSAASVRAFGSGVADGLGSQIAFEAVDPATEASSLFDLQAWVDAGDIGEVGLLIARASAELALRLGSWQNVTGEPLARDRLADSFPLTGVLGQFRWRAGDGARLLLPDVNIVDTVPRQFMQVSRSFASDGRTNTQIGFRSRPKDPLVALRKVLVAATRPFRAYQRSYKTISGAYNADSPLAAGATGTPSIVPLLPQDVVVTAKVRITSNVLSLATNLLINSVDQTSALGGPWSTSPVEIDITALAVAQAATSGRLFTQVKNVSGSSNTSVNHQLVIEISR